MLQQKLTERSIKWVNVSFEKLSEILYDQNSTKLYVLEVDLIFLQELYKTIYH